VDEFPDMLRPELARLPRIVYEFDSPDLRNATMYPAMVRTFRRVGAQFAAMFAYDMQRTASRNLGWQTHYLSLAYTPRKAMSTVIAAEAMRRLPRLQDFGPYPRNTRFGDFRISAEDDLAELVTADAFLHAGSTRSAPPDPAALRRVAGYGSSPVVRYEGEGLYFLDRVRDGVWRLEVYPDAVPVRDPFEPPSPNKIVTRAIARAWPMTVTLPDLGGGFSVQPVTGGSGRTLTAAAGRFAVRPGVYVLSAGGPIDFESLPGRLGRIGFAEFYAPPPDTLPPTVVPLLRPSYVAGREAELRARVVDSVPPDSVVLFLRAAAADYRRFPMRHARGYEYAATIAAESLPVGPHELAIAVYRGRSALTFPGGGAARPDDWNFPRGATWPLEVVSPQTPLLLFDPAADAPRLAFTRIGDAGRRGLYRLSVSEETGRTVFRFPVPVDSTGWSPADYAASLVVLDRVRARGTTVANGSALRLRVRGLGARQVLHVTLMEHDGTSWSSPVEVGGTWKEPALPLSSFRVARGVKLPQGFPGEWNYWVGPAAGRGGPGDRLRLDRLERLQLSLRRDDAGKAVPDGYGVEVEWVRVELEGSGSR
jgi:hypothetical protein